MKHLLSSLALLLIYSISLGQRITLYADCQYRGQSLSLSPGRYNLNNSGFGAYKLSSLRVPAGLKAVLYYSLDPGNGPEKLRLTSDMSCLPSNWNDKTGSILIENDNYTNNDGANNYPSNTGGNNYPSYNGGGEQVIVYEDASFRGRSSALQPGRYDFRQMGINDDAMSSIRIPAGYKVTIYTDPKFRGSSLTFYANVFSLNRSFNDYVSSIIVEYNGDQNNNNNYQPPSNNDYQNARDRVYVYSDCQYKGTQGSLAPGRYDVKSMGVGNDQISSMRIPYGFRVTAFENSGFRGNSQVFTSDNYCMQGMWNDKISSIIVEAPGGYSSDNNQSYTPSYGNGAQAATLYANAWFKGDHTVFGEGRHDLRYTTLDANITSVSLQNGYSIIAYDDYDFRGRVTYINGTSANLNAVGWNDKIRSFIIRRN